MNLNIHIDSKTLGHAIGIVLSGVMFVATEPAFVNMLPPDARPFLQIFLALIPWFTMMGINVGKQPENK